MTQQEIQEKTFIDAYRALHYMEVCESEMRTARREKSPEWFSLHKAFDAVVDAMLASGIDAPTHRIMYHREKR